MVNSNDEAIARYMTGKAYIETAKYACMSPHRNSAEREIMTLLPLSMLAGFALELLFKAWLLAAGKDKSEVRKLGHKIDALYAETQVEGLVATSALDEVVTTFGSGHQDFTFRYIEPADTVKTINWSAAFAALDHLDAIVDAKVGASASYGLHPGH